jgi:hypothetical protein
MARPVLLALLALLVAVLLLGQAPAVKGDALSDALVRAQKCVRVRACLGSCLSRLKARKRAAAHVAPRRAASR